MDKPLGELDDSCWRDEAEQAQICDDNLSIFSKYSCVHENDTDERL